eukprot:m.126743 g.126743  ORF g.126743 m.126743 type:complete len:232 (-) comp11195_c1_seq1:5105-5800(-)
MATHTPPVTVSVMEEDDIETAARMTAAAFADSPVYAWILRSKPLLPFSSAAESVEVLQWLLVRNFKLRLHLGAGRLGKQDGAAVCFYLLEPPEAMAPLSLGTMLWAGLWQVPFRFGYQATRRLLAAMDWYEETTAQVAARAFPDGVPKQPICKLERMSVTPGLQGSGIGTYCLQKGLDEAAARGEAVLLTTQEERNVTFYKRLGFRVIEELDFITDEGSIKNWFMLWSQSQ